MSNRPEQHITVQIMTCQILPLWIQIVPKVILCLILQNLVLPKTPYLDVVFSRNPRNSGKAVMNWLKSG